MKSHYGLLDRKREGGRMAEGEEEPHKVTSSSILGFNAQNKPQKLRVVGINV